MSVKHGKIFVSSVVMRSVPPPRKVYAANGAANPKLVALTAGGKADVSRDDLGQDTAVTAMGMRPIEHVDRRVRDRAAPPKLNAIVQEPVCGMTRLRSMCAIYTSAAGIHGRCGRSLEVQLIRFVHDRDTFHQNQVRTRLTGARACLAKTYWKEDRWHS